MRATDDGIRVGRPSSRTSSSPSRPSVRAARSSPGEWSEDLGRFGSEPWVLPGQGDRGAGCGEFYPESVCETCGEPSFAARVCGSRSCPDCWGAWAQKAAIRATRRIQAFRHTQSGVFRQTAHAVVSPSEGDVMTERAFFEGRSRAAEIAREKGWRGFAVVPHPFRVTEEGKERYECADPDYGIWVWLRNDVDDWREFTYWSPHYHIVGLTAPNMEPAGDGDEWVYRFIRSFESYDGVRDSGSHRDLYGGFRYLLSHTGYPEASRKQMVTWYGDLANSVFVDDAREEWQNQKPSEGVRSALTREIESVAGESLDDDQAESVDEDDTVGDCPCDGCDGALIDVFDVRQFLRYNDRPPDVVKKMTTALEWRLGDVQPPPGLKCPQTEADAREAFKQIV